MANISSGALDAIQTATIEDEQKKQNLSKDKYHFDKLKLFFGEDYFVHGIRISQPTIGDILKIGEKNFYTAISPFTNNSTSIRLMLYDLGIENWCKIKDIEVYCILSQLPGRDYTPLNLIFNDINFLDFKLIPYEDECSEKKLGLYNKKTNDLLTEEEYMEIAEYIRTIINIHPKIEKAKGKTTRDWMRQEDKMNMLNQNSNSQDTSNLLPIISALTNHPGFKYKLEELKEVKIYQFYDAVQRLQIYEQTHALMGGSYSGFCDTSKINREQFNFMREI